MGKRLVKIKEFIGSVEIERIPPRPVRFSGPGCHPKPPGDILGDIGWVHSMTLHLHADNAYHLERGLEPEAFKPKKKNGKPRKGTGRYRHALYGRSGIGKKTLATIRRRVPQTDDYLKSPFRALFQWEELSLADRKALFNGLRPSLKCYAHRFLATLHDPQASKEQQLVWLRAIRREGDPEALACCILLLLDADDMGNGDAVVMLAEETIILCGLLTLHPPYWRHKELLWNHLRDWYLVRADKYGKAYGREVNTYLFWVASWAKMVMNLAEIDLLPCTMPAITEFLHSAIAIRVGWAFRDILQAKQNKTWKTLDDVPEPIHGWLEAALEHEQKLRVHARSLAARDTQRESAFRNKYFIELPFPRSL